MSRMSQMVIHEAEREIHIGRDSLNILLFPPDRASLLQTNKAGLTETVSVNISHSSDSVNGMIPLNYR